MALSPKESGKFISERAKHVTIQDEGVKELTKEVLELLKKKSIQVEEINDHECYPHDVSDEVALDWLFVLDTLNFCFWTPGPGKWIVSRKGKTYTGYFALCAAVARALDEGVDIINPKVYSKLSLPELKHILRSDTEKNILLLEERLKCLHQVGAVLLEKFEGTFVNCVKASKKSAQKLLNLVTSEFECFNDTAVYKGQQVSFHKRAQIVVADIWTHFSGQGYGEFHDIDSITMFADYRVPQPMVHFGALKYSDELNIVLKEERLLESGCEYEVEIRGCSIEVIERVREGCLQAGVSSNSIVIDNLLWLYRRHNAMNLNYIPFHRVASIYY